VRLLGLGIGSAVLWFLLSGNTGAVVLGMGAASVVLVLFVARRADVVDDEGVPVRAVPAALRHSVWLVGAIVRSNLDMLRLVLARRIRIEPQLVEVPLPPGGAIAQVTFANSITMTPGTLTLEVADGRVLVHALTEATANELRSGELARRAARVDSRPTAELRP